MQASAELNWTRNIIFEKISVLCHTFVKRAYQLISVSVSIRFGLIYVVRNSISQLYSAVCEL